MDSVATLFGDLLQRLSSLPERLEIDQVVDVLRYDPMQPLLFNTGLFLVLFVAFLCIYRLVRGVRVLKMALVILFSLYFYYKSSGFSCLILLGVCVSDWVLGLLMDKAASIQRGSDALRRLIVLSMSPPMWGCWLISNISI